MSAAIIDDKTERVSVFIDSKDRVSGTNENFTIQLSSIVERVKSVEVVSVEIPYSFYTLNSSNNTLKFTNSTQTTFTVTVAPGNYSATQFTGVLQAAMNAVMSGFTIAYNVAQYTLTFTNASQFNILLSGSTMAPVIGVTADSGLGTSYTTPGAINLSGPNYIYIKSDKLTRPKVTPPFTHSVPDIVLYKMVVSTGPGTTLIEKNLYPNPVRYGVRQKIQTIDLQLTDPDGNVLNLNGQRWSMTLLLDVV